MLSDKSILLGSKLTALQRKYVINLVGSNMSQREAYVKAGGKAKSENAQDVNASRMLADAKVKKFYDCLMENSASKAVMTKEQALLRLTRSAEVNITDVCDFTSHEVGKDKDKNPIYQTVWTIKDSKDIPDHIAACIKSVAITASGPKLELHDSHGAIKQLSDMLGWNAPRKAELTGKDGEAIQLRSDISSPEIAAALTGLMEKL